MAQYDPYYIEERMRELNWRLRRIDWNDRAKRHEIIAVDAMNQEYIAMTVKPGQLDDRVLTRLKEIDPTNGYNPFRELEKWQKQKERDEERKVEDMAYGMADTLYKPLIQDAFY
jgi:hypothetical protein